MYPTNDYRDYLAHHVVKGQQWYVRNGPPYPLNKDRIIFSSNDTDEERDHKVKEVVKRNLHGMRKDEIDTTSYKRYIFEYEDGTVHETRKGETKEEARDIRDFEIAYKMAKEYYNDLSSGKVKEDVKAIERADKEASKRKKRYGSGEKYLTIGIPHASKAYSINRFSE